jgi:hypothetical protein
VAEPAIVDVAFEERYWYPDDGGVVWVAGFHVVDADGRFVGRDAPLLAERGLVVTHAAGAAQHHAAGLASDGAAPGQPLTLRRDPANAFDPNAIAVDTATASRSAGCPARRRRRSPRRSTPASRGRRSCCASSGPRRASRAPA